MCVTTEYDLLCMIRLDPSGVHMAADGNGLHHYQKKASIVVANGHARHL
jgi:hypothetical protein